MVQQAYGEIKLEQAGTIRPTHRQAAVRNTESAPVRWALTGIALLFLGLFLFLPLLLVFIEAFRNGIATYIAALRNDETFSAICLTLLVVAVAVPINAVFGIAAAWLIAKHDFRGKSILTTLIDLPFTVSPVIAGLLFILLFGANGWLGPWLAERDLKVVFAVPGIVIATMFVTFPFVARELVPLMQVQGDEEEQAALLLGANGWQTFRRITLPNIKWALVYGLILCTARAVGEFGAVSVVSGHIRGQTNTMTLQVEILFNEYNFVGAFAAASLLSAFALVTLLVKNIIERFSPEFVKK
ncbi:MAG: sulfate ABC transporter permease subunit CysW [Planctomycetes bacterium]|nr:sulfate ABC transporter permease subunit CysW [Planctomycetota bacterium]